MTYNVVNRLLLQEHFSSSTTLTFFCIPISDTHTVISFSGIRHGNKCVSLTWYIETESGANLMLDDVGLAISETVCWFSSISSSNSSNHQLNAAGRKTTEGHSNAVFWPLLVKPKHWTAHAFSGKTDRLWNEFQCFVSLCRKLHYK